MAKPAELYALQKIDIIWDKVRARLIRIKKLQGESEKLIKARAKAAKLDEQVQAELIVQRDAELETESLAERITETNARLMGGTVTNPKELEALQASLEALRRQQASVEDRGVEAMTNAEDLSTELAAANSIMVKLQKEWEANQGSLDEEEQKMRRNFLILRKQRETLAASLDEESLNEYERLRTRKGGIAISKVDVDVCGVCNVQLPTGVIGALRTASIRTTCPSCGRILHAE